MTRPFEKRRPKPLEKVEPHQLSDGNWVGCRHFTPLPAPVTGQTDTGEPILGSAPSEPPFDCVGPEPHEHIKETE